MSHPFTKVGEPRFPENTDVKIQEFEYRGWKVEVMRWPATGGPEPEWNYSLFDPNGQDFSDITGRLSFAAVKSEVVSTVNDIIEHPENYYDSEGDDNESPAASAAPSSDPPALVEAYRYLDILASGGNLKPHQVRAIVLDLISLVKQS